MFVLATRSSLLEMKSHALSLERQLEYSYNYDRDYTDWISITATVNPWPSSALEYHEAGVQLLQKMQSSEGHPWLPHPLAVGQPTPDQSRRGVYERGV